jgi:hypothetical protein
VNAYAIKLTVLGLLCLTCGWLLYDTYLSSQAWENPPELVGTRDLIAFWGGVQVFIKGGNPYNFNQLFEVQKIGLPQLQSEQYFLNPPWAIPLFLPLMYWPFQVTRLLWSLFNISALLTSTLIIRTWFPSNRPLLPNALAATVFFLPAIMMIWFGQLSLFVYLSLVVGFHAYRKKYDFLAGMLWVPLTLKPHLVYLVALYLGYRIISEKRWRVVAGASSLLLALNLFVLSFNPDIFMQYASIDRTPLIYKSSTLPTLVRIVWLNYNGNQITWPVFGLPLLASGALIAYFIKVRPVFSDAKDMSFYLSLSLFLAPYAWMYDYSLLVLVQITTLHYSCSHTSPSPRFRTALYAIAGLTLLPLVVLFQEISNSELLLLGSVLAASFFVAKHPFIVKKRMHQTLFIIALIQTLSIVTGYIFSQLLSFVWFPGAILVLAWNTFALSKSESK